MSDPFCSRNLFEERRDLVLKDVKRAARPGAHSQGIGWFMRCLKGPRSAWPIGKTGRAANSSMECPRAVR